MCSGQPSRNRVLSNSAMLRDSRSILVFEPHAGSMKRTVSLVEQTGYEPLAATTTDQATAALEEDGLVAVLVSHTPAGVELGQYIREFTCVEAPLGAIVSQSEASPEGVVAQMAADGFLRRPFTTSTLESFLSIARPLANLRRRLNEVQGSVAELEGRLQRSGLTSARTGFHNFEAVKDLLVVEVRRAKRYGYPLAVLMVGLDPAVGLEDATRPGLPRDVTAGLGRRDREVDPGHRPSHSLR
jgi:PleD family two-component response regulator